MSVSQCPAVLRHSGGDRTILVDLSTNRPLDLLPDANAATLATWLQTHPGVEVNAGDRAGTFAEGARQGAPDAVQGADRFHLMHFPGQYAVRALFGRARGSWAGFPAVLVLWSDERSPPDRR